MTDRAHSHHRDISWTFYLTAMLYDFLALSISTVYLLKPNATEVMFPRHVASILTPHNAARILKMQVVTRLAMTTYLPQIKIAI